MTLHPLDRKMLRDLWRMRLQALAIALLIACGVAVAVMAFSTQQALVVAQRDYYAATRFADVFATAKRAPRVVAQDLARIDGVLAVDARASKSGLMEVRGQLRPAIAQLVALPDDERTALDRVVLMQGRMPDPHRTDEVIALKTFLDAAHVRLGERLPVVINGRRMAFRIVGAALSPEYAYLPGAASALPDEAHQAVLWGPRLTIERATGLGGAFSTVALKLAAGASVPKILLAVDRALAPYGGQPSVGRADQVSNKFQEDRIVRLGVIAWVLPPVFLAVAAGLVALVLGRMVETEREQIGLLKAFGYTDFAAASGYLKTALLIALVGVAAGGAVGAWLGRAITELFAQYVRFPHLPPRFAWSAFLVASAFSIAAAVLGSLRAVRRAAALEPAVAMRPPAPTAFRRGLMERFGVWRRLDEPTRIVARNIERYPGRALLTTLGLGVSLSLLVGSQFMFGSLDEIVDQAYYRARHWTDVIDFAEDRDVHAVAEAARLPGALLAEPVRNVPAYMRFGGRERRIVVSGLDAGAQLARPLDAHDRVLPFEGRGVVLSKSLAEWLGVKPGQTVDLEITEERRPRLALPVTGVAEEYAGYWAFIRRGALNRILGDGDFASGAYLIVAPDRRLDFYRAIEHAPEAVSAISRTDTVASWRSTVAQDLDTEMIFYVGLAGAIAFGVAYNVSRIAFADRARDLATLRVLGFSEAECAYILLGELAFLALAAAPLGILGGIGIAESLVAAFSKQELTIPLRLTPSAFGVALLAYFIAVALGAALVGARVHRLDLVAVLKTRD